MVTIYSCPIGFRLILQNGSKLFSSRFISFCRRFVYSVQDCRNLGQNTCRKTRPARSKSMMGKGPLLTIARLHHPWSVWGVAIRVCIIFCSVQNCSLTTGISHSQALSKPEMRSEGLLRKYTTLHLSLTPFSAVISLWRLAERLKT